MRKLKSGKEMLRKKTDTRDRTSPDAEDNLLKNVETMRLWHRWYKSMSWMTIEIGRRQR